MDGRESLVWCPAGSTLIMVQSSPVHSPVGMVDCSFAVDVRRGVNMITRAHIPLRLIMRGPIRQRSELVLVKYLFLMSARHQLSWLNWLPLVPLAKFRESNPIRTGQLPSKSFPIHHSCTVIRYSGREIGSALKLSTWRRMRGATVTPLPLYIFMAWWLIKRRTTLYLPHHRVKLAHQLLYLFDYLMTLYQLWNSMESNSSGAKRRKNTEDSVGFHGIRRFGIVFIRSATDICS
jgi:hypothetical protein